MTRRERDARARIKDFNIGDLIDLALKRFDGCGG